MKRSFSDRDGQNADNDDNGSIHEVTSDLSELDIMRIIDSSVAEQGVPQLDVSIALQRLRRMKRMMLFGNDSFMNRQLRELESDNTKDRVQALLWISRNLQDMNMSEKTAAMKLLLKRVGVEADNDTKCMIVTLITKLITIPTQSSQEIFDAFVEQLHISKSTKVKSQVYRGLTKLLLVRGLNWRQSAQIALSLSNLCKFAIFELADTHHLIRAASIRLLSVLSSILHQVHQYEKERITKDEKQNVRSRSEPKAKTEISSSEDQHLDIIEVQRIISHYVVDSDQRVRKSALEALVHMRLCGCPLDLSLYKHGVRALKDDFEDVRMGGLNLIWALGCLYPEYRMRLAHDGIDEDVRLLDDAFVKICDMVNDVAVNVRTKACTIMASFQHVDPNVLSQTFSKQIMSHNKRLARNKKAGGQKVTHRQSGKMIPVAEGDFDVESEEFRILDSGACGAFVHGLEDEYKEVRNASIDSICELCMYSDQFTTKAVDFLVDMFNDEIDQVRINAIQSLRKIGTRTRLVFDGDQLEIVIGALEDADKAAREGTHDLLRVVRLSAQSSLTILLESLKINMERYPEDQISIYRCLKDMGRSHHDYILQMVSDLLKYDKKYLPREANADDKNRKYLHQTLCGAHIGHIILIVNACYEDLSIVELLPKYCFSHFVYLQSRFPDCFPRLKKIFDHAPADVMKFVDNMAKNLEGSKSIDDVNQYLNGTMDMISSMNKSLQGSVNKNLMQTIDIISRNLQYAAELSPLISGKAEFADMYVSCCKKLIKYKGETNLGLESEASLKNASEILVISYRMEHTFLGLMGQSRHAAMYFRVLASMLWLFGIMKQIASNNPTNITSMLVSIIERINVIQRAFEQDHFKLIDLTDLRTNLVKACNYPSSAKFSALYSFVRSFTPIGLDLKNPLKRTCAKITLPTSNSDKPVKFSSNLPLKIHIEAQLEFVDYINSIAIMVILPDKSTRQFWPSHHNFKPTTPYCYVLVTDIELDVELWTDKGMLQIHIVKWFEADLPGIDDYILRYPISSMSHHDFEGTSSTSSLRLCDALNYYISPTKDD